MFDDMEFIEEHKDSIMGTMRSAAVCLHVMLKMNDNPEFNDFFEQELFQEESLHSEHAEHMDRGIGTLSRDFLKKHFMVNKLSDILFHDRFDDFREKFIAFLQDNGLDEYAQCFAERLEIAQNLPTETQRSIGSIMSSLQKGTGKYFDYFFSTFMEAEHHITQSAILELVFQYFPAMHNLIHFHPGSHQSDDVNYYDMQNDKDESFSYLWGNIPKGKETIEQLELINQRIKCIQEFKAGVLDHTNKDHVWKLKETEPSSPTSFLEEVNTLLQFSSMSSAADFSERLSLTVAENEHPLVDKFKQKLQKIKLSS